MQTKDILKSVSEIIKHELSLADDQIWLYNQKKDIPKDTRVYFSIGLLSSKPYASKLEYVDMGAGELTEAISTNFQDVITINIYSRSTLPIDDKNTVLSALRGTYSQQKQMTTGYYIAVLPQTIMPITEEDGTTILYRFNIPIVVQYMNVWIKDVEFFDKYKYNLITN